MKAVRDTLEQDIEQQVAEYQDMMKCCANLQQENMVISWLFSNSLVSAHQSMCTFLDYKYLIETNEAALTVNIDSVVPYGGGVQS